MPRYDPAFKARVLQDYVDGLGYRKLAQRHPVSLHTIKKWVQRAGLNDPTRNPGYSTFTGDPRIAPSFKSKKLCKGCGEKKARDQFHKDSTRRDRLQNRCIDCQRAKAYFRRIEQSYGLSPAEWEALHAAHDHKCPICLDPLRETPGHGLAVDHCHKTGKVRGLLCHLCNTGIGHLRDNPESCERAAKYLRDST